jgi:hypothetical protein
MTAAEALARHLDLTVWCSEPCREGRVVRAGAPPADLVFETDWTRFTCQKCGNKASWRHPTDSMKVKPVLKLGR